jgi:hypothetical protein
MVEYEATTGTAKVTFDNAHAAQVFVEDAGEGSVVRWVGVPNMPGRLPEVEFKSRGLWTFNKNARRWEARSVYSGACEVLDYVSPTGEVSA